MFELMRAVPACGHFSSSCVFSLSLLVLALLPTISYHSPLLPCMHDPFFSSSSHLFECAFSKLSPFLFPSPSVPHCCCVRLLLIPWLQLIHSPTVPGVILSFLNLFPSYFNCCSWRFDLRHSLFFLLYLYLYLLLQPKSKTKPLAHLAPLFPCSYY